jgi:hypothetical protein
VNHRLGLSAVASTGGPGVNILHRFDGKSPEGEILFNRLARSDSRPVAPRVCLARGHQSLA